MAAIGLPPCALWNGNMYVARNFVDIQCSFDGYAIFKKCVYCGELKFGEDQWKNLKDEDIVCLNYSTCDAHARMVIYIPFPQSAESVACYKPEESAACDNEIDDLTQRFAMVKLTSRGLLVRD